MSPPDGTPARRRRPDASMTLLNEVMKRPLDPGYAEAAPRRAAPAPAGQPTPPPGPGHRLGQLVAVGLGLVVTAAVAHLRAPQPAATQARSVLADQVVERSLQLEELTNRSVALAAEVEELERAGTLPSSLREANDLDKLSNGSTAVSGPGLVVTLTDGGLAGDERAAARHPRDQPLVDQAHDRMAGGHPADLELLAQLSVRRELFTRLHPRDAFAQRAFDLDRTMINLNNGGVSPAPTHVLDQMIRDLRFSNQLPVEHMWRVLEPRIESVRRELAKEFGCDPEEMAKPMALPFHPGAERFYRERGMLD
jgi:hypothetical protein